MIELLIIYLVTYTYAVNRMWSLSKLAIAQLHLGSLKSLDNFIDENTSPEEPRDMDAYREKIVGQLRKGFKTLEKGAIRGCLLNGIYLCPMVVLFCIIDEEEFSKTFITEYKSNALLEILKVLDDVGLKTHDVRSVIADTLDFVEKDGESND